MVRPEVFARWWTTELRFARGIAQSRMSRLFPDRLLIDYTRTMLAALLQVPAPRRIGMVGLGGGSQAKFLLRRRFRVPDDDHRFRVVEGDAALLLGERWPSTSTPLISPAIWIICDWRLARRGSACSRSRGRATGWRSDSRRRIVVGCRSPRCRDPGGARWPPSSSAWLRCCRKTRLTTIATSRSVVGIQPDAQA